MGPADQGVRYRYGHFEPPSGGFSKGDARVKAIDDRLDDGEAESRSIFIAAEQAMERVENAFTIVRGDAGTGVLYRKRCAVRSDFDRKIDPAALPGCSGSRCRQGFSPAS